MKTKVILGLATLAALAMPAIAEDGGRYRDHDRDQRTYYAQTYRYDNDDARQFDREGYGRREAQEQRERREHREQLFERHPYDRDRR